MATTDGEQITAPAKNSGEEDGHGRHERKKPGESAMAVPQMSTLLPL
jgi:hypothetical protein